MDSTDSDSAESRIPFDLLELPRESAWVWWGRWFRRYGAQVFSCLGCLTLLVLILAPVFISANKAAKYGGCLSNLKQIGTAVLMYQQDWDERYMARVGWMDAAVPYLKSEEVFRCPEFVKSEPSGYGYAFNALLSRRLMKHVPVPDSTPMVYDANAYLRSAFDSVATLPRPGRHIGGNNVGYSDGHAKWRRDSERVEPLPKGTAAVGR